MQDYKSLCVAVMICATMVNTQTHSFCPAILLAELAELKMSQKDHNTWVVYFIQQFDRACRDNASKVNNKA